MANVQFGTNTPAVRKQRLYYTSTSTIQEGMPVCFEFDATTNVLGWDNDLTQALGTTTDEGYQNEGKFLRVEDPAADNIQWFAGVVAAGGYVGKAGPKWVDVYSPNGAIVPVRAGVACTVGRTILSVITATQYLGQPLSATQARPVAIAEETVDRSSTAGLCLAKLDPSLFLYQDNTGDALIVAASGTAATTVNHINLTTAQTGGRFTAFEVLSASTGAIATTGYGAALYVEHTWGAAVTGQQATASIWSNITAGTQTFAQLFGLEVGMWESGATLSGITQVIAPLCLRTDFAEATAANTHYMMYLRAETASDAPDGLFMCYTSRAINAQAKSAAAVTHVIPIRMQLTQSGGLAAGTYYIMVSDTL